MAITVSGTNFQVKNPNVTVVTVRARAAAAAVAPGVSGLIGPWDYNALTVNYPYPATTYATMTADYSAETYLMLTEHI